MKTVVPGFSELDRAGQLARSIADARALLAFASQTNRKIDPVLVKEIAEASEALESSSNPSMQPTAKTESDFWVKYDTLAVALAPVSAESIRHTEIVKAGNASPAWLPLGFAIAGLLLFVILQAYSAGGTDLLEQQRAAEKSQSEILSRGRDASATLDRAFAKLISFDEKSQDQTVHKFENSIKSAGLEKIQSDERNKLDLEVKELQYAVNRNSDELRSVQDKIRPSKLLLEKWYQPMAILLGLISLDTIYQDREKLINKEFTEPAVGANPSISKKQFLDSRLRAALDRLAVEKSRAVQSMASMILAPLNLYAIPAVLGVLGAMTYMLRSITTQVASYTYLPSPRGVTMSRITLGMIGGVIGSLFITSTFGNDTGLKALPPLAIPFLFGYAVDVFFALLDKLVSTFTSEGATQAPR